MNPHHGSDEYLRQQFSAEQRGLLKRFNLQERNPREEQSFSQGKLNDDDEGDLYFKIATDAKKRVILIEFSHPTKWIGLPIKEAEELRDQLTERLHALRGIS